MNNKTIIRVTTGRNEYMNIDIDDILYLKADGNYTEIFLISNNKITIYKNLKKTVEEIINTDTFIKVKRNIIVNTNNIIKLNTSKKAYILLKNNIKRTPSVRLKRNIINTLTQ